MTEYRIGRGKKTPTISLTCRLTCFNRSLKTISFPDFLKLAVITPIPKITQPTEPKNYRPVSVTPIAARVFERILYRNYVSDSYNRSISRCQFGFRKRNTTEQAILKLVNDCRQYKQAGYDYVRIFTVDMSKALDTVSHLAAMYGMMALTRRINPFVLNTLRDFLLNRCQITMDKGAK